MTQLHTSLDQHIHVRGHMPALDGLRGLAVIMVMLYHFSITGIKPDNLLETVYYGAVFTGWMGVDLFFVLSGFLISGILLDTRDTANYFRVFYARRFVRIFPLYYGFLAIVIFVLPLFPLPVSVVQELDTVRQGQVWLWLYISNVHTFLHGEKVAPGFGHFWSLAVEEHFYMVWPLVIWACPRGMLMRVCVILFLSSGVIRWLLLLGGWSDYVVHTFTLARLDQLAAGAWVACLLRGSLDHATVLRWCPGVLAASAMAAAVFILTPLGKQDFGMVLTHSILSATFCSLLLLAASSTPSSSRLGRLFHHPALRHLGTISYGLYVFHVPLRGLILRLVPKPIPILGTELLWQAGFILIAFFVSLACAELSWHLYEKHWLKLKRHMQYRTALNDVG